MNFDRVVFRIHAIQRMFERSITEKDVLHVLRAGTTIEEYPEDFPYPSRLILGWRGARPLHVVIAQDVKSSQIIIITVYEPQLDKWQSGFAKRKEK